MHGRHQEERRSTLPCALNAITGSTATQLLVSVGDADSTAFGYDSAVYALAEF
jgi:hypothetical protein